VALCHTNLRAVILFGSVARHDERPLEDTEPSDVDLLLLFDLAPGCNRLSLEHRLGVDASICVALDRYLDAPREVNTVLAAGDLSDWDPAFVEAVAQDGIVLWRSGSLPSFLSPLARRESSAVDA